MIKAYPPIWCQKDDCGCCSLGECNKRTLSILLPYRDTHTPFQKRGLMEVTSVAVYLGYCPRLARFFMEFPSVSPIAVIYSNFINPTTMQPTTQPIQRILLDALASSDPSDLTDDIFKYRGLMLSPSVGMSKFKLGTKKGVKTFSFSRERMERTGKEVSELLDRVSRGIEEFPRTNESKRCDICLVRQSC